MPAPRGGRPSSAALARQIADKPGFVGDVLGVLATMAPNGKIMPSNVQLNDLQIQGDSAHGVVAEGQAAKAGRPTEFKRINGRWYVEYSDEPAPPAAN